MYGRITGQEKYYTAPLMDLLEYYPAVDMEQRTERTSNFITMVLGYIVVNLMYQSAAVMGFNAYETPFFAFDVRFLGKAGLGLMLAWVLNWLFFDVDNRHVQHALTRNFYYSISTSHLATHISYRIQFCYEPNCHRLDSGWCRATTTCLSLGLQRLKPRRAHGRICRTFR